MMVSSISLSLEELSLRCLEELFDSGLVISCMEGTRGASPKLRPGAAGESLEGGPGTERGGEGVVVLEEEEG